MNACVRPTLPGIAVLLCAQLLAFGDHTFNIFRQPASQAVIENCPVTFSVSVDRWGVSYQWLRDGEPITGATNWQFTIPHALLPDQGLYSVIVSNEHYSMLSSNAALTIRLDTIRPTPIEVAAGPVSNTIIVSFQTICGGLDEESAEDRWNYSLAGAEILSAELLVTGRAVLLTTSPLTEGAFYELYIENIRDVLGHVTLSARFSFEAGALPCPVHVDAIMSIQQPQDTHVTLGRRPVFTVAIQGTFADITYSWETFDDQTLEWTPIPNATQTNLTLPPAQTCAQTGSAYRCRVGFGDCFFYTETASLTVSCDCAPLALIGAAPLPTLDGVIITFGETVIPYTATDIFNYEIAGLEILEAQMNDHQSVLLRTTPQTPGQQYTVIVNGVSDYGDPSCGANLIPPDSAITFYVPQRPRSGLYEINAGTFTACCGFAGDLGYLLPAEEQSFLRLEIDAQNNTATMTFLGYDAQTIFSVVPCPFGAAIPFSFSHGLVLSNRVIFHVDPGPRSYWNYTVVYSDDTLRIDGSLRIPQPSCTDVPDRFGHTNVFAVLVPPRPRIESWERTDSELRFQFTGEPPYDYFVEYTGRLQPPNWLSLTNFRAKIQTIHAVVTDSTTNRPARFYRIRKEHCFCRSE